MIYLVFVYVMNKIYYFYKNNKYLYLILFLNLCYHFLNNGIGIISFNNLSILNLLL